MGVRARVQLAFALSGLVVSTFLAAVSWSLTTSYLHDQRELTATRSAFVSSDLLARRIGPGRAPTVRSLRESVAVGSDAVYVSPGLQGGVALNPAVGPGDLPRSLVELAAAGTPAQQRIEVDGQPALAVAVPLVPDGGVYVEVLPLTELDSTLRLLGLVLTVTAALAVVLAAALGRWATQRTLRPLRALVTAAGEVARGDLDTRLDAAGDPDLEPLATAFNRTTASLRARVERDARFASDVSHELRSPITTMVNAAELLHNRSHEMSPAGREALEMLHEEVERFRDLVEDLLEVSRDDQLTEVVSEPVVLATLVRQAADREASRAVTVVDPAAADVLVAADPRRLERVVSNLVHNADLHGGGVRQVEVTRHGRSVRIAVRDEGPGIPRGERELVFERFFRGRASRASSTGSGLGLAIVAQHVRAHGGRVWLDGDGGCGSTFVVELPALEDRP